ncbi:aldo/keto reductase [Flammeovirga kamogawensis]|uniref:Aldo/keto reductase n=1 Tax=Flammeovirga kamogawensis TaxID=373891 RepID=A0ABX8H3H4_9BACT|nr:aldo/keto reductase [Flammeovirga kamogawensis]MBB6461940.1 L-glyceraldehyde 3-phosphate reductase [Flammeovirga kamogawensis]QWG10453.1 aldo/keto reductase [Flammeovirga kamogawensis]TRX63564.1 L-glyceraldehyde 3-phosphate reductase [Flammeovirga kamogawensis]
MEIFDKAPIENYTPNQERYDTMHYQRCGKSGVLLPRISLGLWHNFGFNDNFGNARNIVRKAFDLGITHLDLANNYGPPYGAAEENFGRILQKDFSAHRDELFIATKAGYDMWPGPYGNWGSKKYLIASLDQSLKRMGLDYVDVFYHHRPDPQTPLEETMSALSQVVKQGKALYIGLSRYSPDETEEAANLLKEMGTPCLIHQSKYSMFEREVEGPLLAKLDDLKIGSIVFSPLAQGMLTNKYVNGIPENSRASKDNTYLNRTAVEEKLDQIKLLHQMAVERGQTLSQMAIAWLFNHPVVTSVLVGASSPTQLEENVGCMKNAHFTSSELEKIEDILSK